jgi:ribosomal protein S18 acetylase RimI-like enzyme
MERAEQWAMERGLGEIELNVWEANQSAIGFYEGLGYEATRRRMRRIIR